MIVMKLTAMETEVFNFVKAHGGRVSMAELAEGLGRTERSVGANVTGLSGEKKGKLVARDKVAAKNENEKDVTYVVLTDAGMEFTPDAE